MSRPYHDRAKIYASIIGMLDGKSMTVTHIARATGVSAQTAHDCLRKLETDGIVAKRRTAGGRFAPIIVTLIMPPADALALSGLAPDRPRMTFDGLMQAWPLPLVEHRG